MGRNYVQMEENDNQVESDVEGPYIHPGRMTQSVCAVLVIAGGVGLASIAYGLGAGGVAVGFLSVAMAGVLSVPNEGPIVETNA